MYVESRLKVYAIACESFRNPFYPGRYFLMKIDWRHRTTLLGGQCIIRNIVDDFFEQTSYRAQHYAAMFAQSRTRPLPAPGKKQTNDNRTPDDACDPWTSTSDTRLRTRLAEDGHAASALEAEGCDALPHCPRLAATLYPPPQVRAAPRFHCSNLES